MKGLRQGGRVVLPRAGGGVASEGRIYIYIYICIHVTLLYVCMCVCMYVCIYIYIHTYIDR